MNQEKHPPLSGDIFDEQTEITVVELCERCAVDPETIDELIAEGILEPSDADDTTRLPYRSVQITRTVIRLQRDLGVNLAGAALALKLLDDIQRLRAELRRR
jgi:chaperone modulatory protein CbpM